MSDLNLSAPLFSIFTTLIEQRVGLAYSLSDKEIFESKLGARALEAGFESPLDYYYYLRYDDPDGAEFQELVQALVVHETFFFREFQQLRAAAERFVRPLVERGDKPRIWCAACSTGEEPLSLAMLLADMDLLHRVEIVASDISTAALARARRGSFGPRAVRQQLPSLASRYLTPTASGFSVAPTLLKTIDWRRMNLLDAQAVQALGEVDVILCRNVLIYFRDEVARAVVSTLASRLRAGGVLLVGVSESLLRLGSSLVCEEHGGAFLYRKTQP